MNYEEKYKEALERAKNKLHYPNHPCYVDVKEIFPELAESEDESTRKELITHLKYCEGARLINKEQYSKFIAWLEKQKKEEPTINFNAKNWYMSEVDGKIHDATYIENKDEKIRKGLIDFFIYLESIDKTVLTDIKNNEIVAWLEKQGKQKPQGKTALEAVNEEKVDNSNRVEPKDYNSIDPHFGKPADKVGPKYKVGDWIVNNNSGSVYLVTEIRDDEYCLWPIDSEIMEYLRIIDVDNEHHLWDITKDANDGDVLCNYHEAYNNPSIFILKKFEHVDFGLVRPSDYSSYCFLTAGNIQRFKEGTYHHKNNIKPATKKQRNLLFQKMKEASYTWDADKKELKKIEQKLDGTFINVDDVREDFVNEVYRVLDADSTNDRANQIIDAFDNLPTVAVEKQGEQKLVEWSEEDEKIYEKALDAVYYFDDKDAFENKKILAELCDWIGNRAKSLRPQKQCDYSPYKAVVESIAEMCEKYTFTGEIAGDFLNNVKAKCKEAQQYDKMYPQNLSNMERIGKNWKPSEEQMKALNEVVNYAANHATMHWNDNVYNTMKALREQLKQL